MAIQDKRVLERRFEVLLTNMTDALKFFDLLDRYGSEIQRIRAMIKNVTPSNYDTVARMIEDFGKKCSAAIADAEKKKSDRTNIHQLRPDTSRKKPR